jgi:UDP-N-acetyl-alpha-D-quinovosamine dehydrogenase
VAASAESADGRRLVVVLGAGGFIGRPLTERLAVAGFAVRAVTRAAGRFTAPIESCAAGTLSADTDWRRLLDGAHGVVHLASRAHAPPGNADWIRAETATAAAIATATTAAGVERVILLSSIKVLGETTTDRPFSAASPADPRDAYGRAKRAAEEAMRRSGAPGLVVIRPPLVYGPGVKGNFHALLRLVTRGVPLPLAAIRNQRSFVFRDNLLDLIALALTHPAAPGGTFLLRDDEAIGTPQLVRELARRLGRPARLFPVPPQVLRLAAAAIGRGDAADRLIGSLSIDDGETRARLGWRPARSLADGLDATCRWFAEAEGAQPGNSRL